MAETHLVLQHVSLADVSPTDPLRFQHLAFVQQVALLPPPPSVPSPLSLAASDSVLTAFLHNHEAFGIWCLCTGERHDGLTTEIRDSAVLHWSFRFTDGGLDCNNIMILARGSLPTAALPPGVY